MDKDHFDQSSALKNINSLRLSTLKKKSIRTAGDTVLKGRIIMALVGVRKIESPTYWGCWVNSFDNLKKLGLQWFNGFLPFV